MGNPYFSILSVKSGWPWQTLGASARQRPQQVRSSVPAKKLFELVLVGQKPNTGKSFDCVVFSDCL